MLVVPRALHGVVPKVVGLKLTKARKRLRKLHLDPRVTSFERRRPRARARAEAARRRRGRGEHDGEARRRPRLTFRFCDESDDGFGWIAEERVARTSHALAVDGRVWLVDAVLWPEALERARALGEPAGVIQLLDRHNRDCADVAAQLGVPHLRVPDRVDAPLEIVRVVNMPGCGTSARCGGPSGASSSSPTRSAPSATSRGAESGSASIRCCGCCGRGSSHGSALASSSSGTARESRRGFRRAGNVIE